MGGTVTSQRFGHELRAAFSIDTITELSADPTHSLILDEIAYQGDLDQELWGRKIFISGNETFETSQLENADGTEQDFDGFKLRVLYFKWADDATGNADLKFDGPWGTGFADVEMQPGETITMSFPGTSALTLVSMHEVHFEPIGGAQGDLTVIAGVSL